MGRPARAGPARPARLPAWHQPQWVAGGFAGLNDRAPQLGSPLGAGVSLSSAQRSHPRCVSPPTPRRRPRLRPMRPADLVTQAPRKRRAEDSAPGPGADRGGRRGRAGVCWQASRVGRGDGGSGAASGRSAPWRRAPGSCTTPPASMRSPCPRPRRVRASIRSAAPSPPCARHPSPATRPPLHSTPLARACLPCGCVRKHESGLDAAPAPPPRAPPHPPQLCTTPVPNQTPRRRFQTGVGRQGRPQGGLGG